MAGCNCGKPATPASTTKYSVLDKSGKEVSVEDSEPEARIKAINIGGRAVVKRR